MRIHIVMHESFEAPGAIAKWISKNNLMVSYTRLYQGDLFPNTADAFDFLIVMGGPQSPATTLAECSHFNAIREIDFIRSAIVHDKFVLGICLGAQMIGEALGAKFDHSPNREIGVYQLTLTGDAKQDPIFQSFPESFLVGHWHGDMPGLTADSKILASSEGCPRQIVRYTSRVYGFQCHFEFTSESIEGMIQSCGQELVDYQQLPFVETSEQLRSHDYSAINQLLFQFLDQLTGAFKNS